MAWSSNGARGGANSKTAAQTSLAATISTATIAAGEIAICYFACDNVATVDGNSTDITSFVDSQSNVWTIIKQYTNGNGTALTGATAGIAICRIKTPLVIAVDTVTMNHPSTITSRSFSIWSFSVSGGANFGYFLAGSVGAVADAATSSPSKVISGLGSQEYLFIASDAIENDSSTMTYTNDVDYIGLSIRGSTGGTAAANMANRGSYRIVTATGDTHQATGVTASDMAGVLIALKEVQVDFPDALATSTATATPTITPERFDFAPETQNLTALATLSFSSEVVGEETVGLTALGTLILSAESFNFIPESLALTATATLILSGETYVPVSGSPYIESLSLTGLATLTLSAEAFWIVETLVAAATAPPTLSAESFNFAPETLALTSTATPTLSGEAFQTVETLGLTATATPSLSSQVVGQETLGLTATATLILSAQSFNFIPETLALTATATPALSAESFNFAPETLALTATATPSLSSQVVGQETLGLTATATLILSGETYVPNAGGTFIESLALTVAATPVLRQEIFFDISGSIVFGSDSILTCLLDTTYASKITVAEAGDALAGFVYLDGLGSAATGSIGKMKLLLYDVDGSGFPRTLIATGTERTITKGQTALWVESDFSGQNVPAGDYWLGPQIGGTANVMRFYRSILAAGNRWSTDAYADGANGTWAFDGTKVGGYKFSVYLQTMIQSVGGAAYPESLATATASASLSLPSEIVGSGPTTGLDSFHGIVLRTGSATSGVTSSMTAAAAQPWAKGVAIAAGWQDLEPTYRGYVFPTAWVNSIIDACDNGYKIIPRIFAGRASPDWLFTGANSTRGGFAPVQTVYLISVEGQGVTDVPVPWDPILRTHYTALLDWLDGKLQTPMPGGRPGTYGDYIISVPITLPTTQGSEMPQQYGSGTWTGVYKGVSGTWDLQSNNKREWLSVSTAPATATDAEKQAQNIVDLGNAWSAAVNLHIAHLSSAHSSLALGALFTDNQARSIQIVQSAAWNTNKARLECYSTNLRTGPNSPYTWRSWNPKTCQCYDFVNSIGGLCANQTASDQNIGPNPVPGQVGDNADPFKHALLEARDDFDARYIEITTSKASAYTAWLRDVYQPTLIPSTAISTSETLSLVAGATPILTSEVLTSTGGNFIENLTAASIITPTLTGQLFETGGMLQLDIVSTLTLSSQQAVQLETVELTATAALSKLSKELAIQVELVTAAIAATPSLAGEDTGFSIPPYDLYLECEVFNVSYTVQIPSFYQQTEIANFDKTVEV